MASWFSQHDGEIAGTTGDHHGPLPQPSTDPDHGVMAGTSARTIYPSPGHRSSVATRPEPAASRQEAAAGPRTARRPPRPTRMAGSPGRRTEITVRAFVSPMCRDHPKWTSNNPDTQSCSRHRRAGGSQKETPGQRHLQVALRSYEGPTPHSTTDRKDRHGHRRLRKPYARSGKNACRGDPEAFTAGNEKGQLSWPFTKSG
jgi:hypothetical protein